MAKNTLSKLKEKERHARQKVIIDAARSVFEKKTYDKVSMAEIAKTAGIAKSSIYTYFTSQESLYVEIAYLDASRFIKDLKKNTAKSDIHPLETTINFFLSYYIKHKAQWRMITHFALHGNHIQDSMEKLNDISRLLMDAFEEIIISTGYKGESRLLAHTLFSALSGILIAFRNYPGRSEKERVAHMNRIGGQVREMMMTYVAESD